MENAEGRVTKMQRKKSSILVVDSSASYIFYVAMLLKKFQYDVQIASTAEDAIRLIARSAPSVVITDTTLPKMSGVDLLKQLKKNSSLSFIPVMIHTADPNPAIKAVCMDARCAGYFIKPVEPDALYRTIQAATEATPRQTIRIRVTLKARITGAGAGPANRVEDVTSLSDGGLYIKTSVPEPVNVLVPLKLLIRKRELALTAVVLYSSVKIGGPHSEPGMGLKFVTIEPEDRNFIREYIREQVMTTMGTEPRK